MKQMTFMKLDLSSLAAVRAFVAKFKASKLGLDSLILNAGVMHSVSVSIFCYPFLFVIEWTVLLLDV